MWGSGMKRWAWVAGLFSIAAVVAPAPAVQAATGVAASPVGALVAQPDARADATQTHVDVGHVLAGITDVTNGQQILAAERTLLEKSWGVALPPLPPKFGAPPPQQGPTVLLVAVALGAGATSVDIDGDGLVDVMTEETSPDFTTTFNAYRGSDGTPLWSHTLPGFSFAVVVGDVDGDGVSDLLSESYLGGSNESTSTSWRDETDYITAMRSGRTGNAIWSQRDTSSYSYSRETKNGLVTSTVTTKSSRNDIVVAPSWAGDVNGDGLGDIVINRYDIADVSTQSHTLTVLTRMHSERVANSHGSVRSGAAGAGAFLTREALNEDGTGWLSVAGQLTGTRAADLM